MRRGALVLLVLAAACSRRGGQNYRNCLKLRLGMDRAELRGVMGEAEQMFPYEEGRSLPHMKGRTAYEWSTPASMAAPVRVTVSEESGLVESVRCGDTVVTAAVFVEPPAPAEPQAPPLELSTTPVIIAPRAARPVQERSASGVGSRGQPLTGGE